MVKTPESWPYRPRNMLRAWLIGPALALSACDAGNAEPAIIEAVVAASS